MSVFKDMLVNFIQQLTPQKKGVYYKDDIPVYWESLEVFTEDAKIIIVVEQEGISLQEEIDDALLNEDYEYLARLKKENPDDFQE